MGLSHWLAVPPPVQSTAFPSSYIPPSLRGRRWGHCGGWPGLQAWCFWTLCLFSFVFCTSHGCPHKAPASSPPSVLSVFRLRQNSELLPSACTRSKAWDLGPAPVPAVLAIGFFAAWPSDLLVPWGAFCQFQPPTSCSGHWVNGLPLGTMLGVSSEWAERPCALVGGMTSFA